MLGKEQHTGMTQGCWSARGSDETFLAHLLFLYCLKPLCWQPWEKASPSREHAHVVTTCLGPQELGGRDLRRGAWTTVLDVWPW